PSSHNIYPLSLHDALRITFQTRSVLQSSNDELQKPVLSVVGEVHIDDGRDIALLQKHARRRGARDIDAVLEPQLHAQLQQRALLDRKSTRLNSSHVNISYA